MSEQNEVVDKVYDRDKIDVITMRGETVTIGSTTHDIVPLPFGRGLQWKKDLNNVLMKLRGDSEDYKDLNPMEKMNRQADYNILEFPSDMLLLVKKYTPYLDWETLEDQITEVQVADVFEAVMRLANPFPKALSRGLAGLR